MPDATPTPIVPGAAAQASIAPEQAAFLDTQRSGRLATVDPQGQPHAVPICYALLDGIIYTPIDEKPKTGDPRELRRIRNILANPKVCLVVDHYEDDDWSRLAWLQVRGEATLVEDNAERAGALAALRARYRQYQGMALEELPLLRITPTRLVGWNWAAALTPRPPLPQKEHGAPPLRGIPVSGEGEPPIP